MNRNDKPALVTSLATAGALTWSAVLVAAFLAILVAYTAVGHLIAAQSIRVEAHPTRVKTAFYETFVPAGWAYYTLDGEDLRMYKTAVGQQIGRAHV